MRKAEMRKIFYVFFAAAVFALALAALSGCSTLTGETAGEYIDDSTITAKANAAIVNDPDAHYLKIDVETTRGNVVLTGFVDSRATEARLVQKIKAIRGVKSVKSLLEVEPPKK
jgi:hyperosmotically inducible protein